MKLGMPAADFQFAALLVALTFCFVAAATYFSVQNRSLQRQIEYGKLQLRQADGITLNGPPLLKEMRELARTNEAIRGVLRANEYPLEPMPDGHGS